MQISEFCKFSHVLQMFTFLNLWNFQNDNFARFFQISTFWGADSHLIFTEIRGLKRMTEVCCKRPEILQRSCKRRPPFSENLPRKSFENPQTVLANTSQAPEKKCRNIPKAFPKPPKNVPGKIEKSKIC